MPPKKFKIQKPVGEAPVAEGTEAPPKEGVRGTVPPKEGMQAVLKIVFSHIADIFEGVVEAIADKYSLDKEMMMEVIKSHKAFTEVALHPILQDLGEAPVPEPEAPPKKFRIKKNTVV